jgi:hypothetical protein
MSSIAGQEWTEIGAIVAKCAPKQRKSAELFAPHANNGLDRQAPIGLARPRRATNRKMDRADQRRPQARPKSARVSNHSKLLKTNDRWPNFAVGAPMTRPASVEDGAGLDALPPNSILG